jgi:hypothetical protein
MQPSELNVMPYYEYEIWVTFLNERNKEEEERQKKQDNSQKQNMPNFSAFDPSKYKFNAPKYK